VAALSAGFVCKACSLSGNTKAARQLPVTLHLSSSSLALATGSKPAKKT